jgi:protein gp37
MASQIDWLKYFDGYKPESWNPVTGCVPDFPCWQRCWARAMVERFGKQWGCKDFSPMFHENWLEKPLKEKKPCVFFTCGMGDMFADGVRFSWKYKIFDVVKQTPQHLYILLTKRPQHIHSWLDELPYDNLIIGTSASTQAELDERLPWLLRTPAAYRMISLEPLISPIWLGQALPGRLPNGELSFSYRNGYKTALDWVVAGCESGPKRRPDNPEWYRSLRDECQMAGVPFFLKQRNINGTVVHVPELDGRQWTEVPEIERMQQCQ